jgi:cytochrome c553
VNPIPPIALLAVLPAVALGQFRPDIPKAWNEEALAAMTLPLAGLSAPIKYAPADWYYRIPERVIYRGYPVYLPNREPHNYLNFLSAQEPEVVFDASKMNTESDWLRGGESVFSSGDRFDLLTVDDIHDLALWEKFRFRADADGSLPGWRYVIRKKGKVELASTLCGGCHEREVDGNTVAGPASTAAIGAPPVFVTRRRMRFAQNWDKTAQQLVQREFTLFSVPWRDPDPAAMVAKLTAPQIFAIYEALPSGVVARSGTSLFFPPKIPDLIGVKDRKFLGATGLHRHLGIADLMRYAILETGIADYSQYGEVRPMGELPDPARLSRLSDAQAYALALYIYSLKPPANPNRLDTTAKRGQKILEREGCATCHPPPLYTNNRLAPVDGFRVPDERRKKYDVMDVVADTDPRLALETRVGSGYYRVPSLKGVRYRAPFEHNGSLATLEDMFDPMRLRDNYVPTGLKEYGVENRPVKGHAYGVKLSFEEREALLAFLHTL